ncbi:MULTISPECIES: hypothetical protein [Methanobacterium]|uniref:Uncharacterized protein n=1 Tax=Methanobacterium bryantii TaxID=2161 RepID=A0A2A2H9G4_METBR|nr:MULTISPECIES: hypothetical protein [Methanobacterium]OEC85682.1 hypothetical protein A9507_13070 [Methanobacterium sp. A39]PAV05883.1 hypothetical protein ASJ80_13550 [Methanobacterium bryantii]
MKRKPVKDYNYQKVKRSLIENGQLKQDKNLLEVKDPDLDDITITIPQEEGYRYEIDGKRLGIVKKIRNRTTFEINCGIFPDPEEIFDYGLAKKQMKLK